MEYYLRKLKRQKEDKSFKEGMQYLFNVEDRFKKMSSGDFFAIQQNLG